MDVYLEESERDLIARALAQYAYDNQKTLTEEEESDLDSLRYKL